MQNLMGRIRRCAEDYNMICAGDKIAVGVSGGKDSLSLLYLLAALRRYYPVPYDLQAVTIDMGLPGMDFSPVAELCAKLDVPYQIKKTEIGPIIFDYRHEKNPCSMCAKMRRGALNTYECVANGGIRCLRIERAVCPEQDHLCRVDKAEAEIRGQ